MMMPSSCSRMLRYTADLNFGKYVYDIQLTKANGKVDTFISKAILKLSEEVD